MKATLVLENGSIFTGESFGAAGEICGEVVFNTSMSGYQEILTDPSYSGQIVTMTYPLIGNYGVNSIDIESAKPWVNGFIVKEYNNFFSNWRAEKSLDQFLKEHNIIALQGIDTRMLTKMIRSAGAMRGIISTTDHDEKSLLGKVNASPSMNGLDLAKVVTTKKSYHWDEKQISEIRNEQSAIGNRQSAVGSEMSPRSVLEESSKNPSDLGLQTSDLGLRTSDNRQSSINNHKSFKVVVFDYGVKYNILRRLSHYGCSLTVVPAQFPAEEVFKLNPDGIFLSNGPGDPAAVIYAIENIKKLIGKKPIFGICLGHQLLALALGAKTYKLKFGHRGANHPVMNLASKEIEITSQNHGFAVEADSLPSQLELTHINLNDQTVEGFRHKELPVFCVQYHPEASPGPHDSDYLFKNFIEMMKD